MPGLTFIHNMCDQDVLISINNSSEQKILSTELLADQRKDSRRMHCISVPQTRNVAPHFSWEFGIDSKPVPNMIDYRIGKDSYNIIQVKMNLCILNTPGDPKDGSDIQLLPEADNQIFIYKQGIVVQTQNNTTWIEPSKGNVIAE